MSPSALKWQPPLLALATGVAIAALEPVAGLPSARTIMSWLTVAFLWIGGLVLAVSALWSLRRAENPERHRALVTEGVYGISRNPLWLGLTFLLFGWVKLLALAWLLVLPFLFWLIVHFVYVRMEERALAGEYGEAYLSYKARVRRWV